MEGLRFLCLRNRVPITEGRVGRAHRSREGAEDASRAAHSGPGRQQNETQFSCVTLMTLSVCHRDTEWASVMSGPGVFHSHSKDRWTCFMTPCFPWQWKDTPSESLT